MQSSPKHMKKLDEHPPIRVKIAVLGLLTMKMLTRRQGSHAYIFQQILNNVTISIEDFPV